MAVKTGPTKLTSTKLSVKFCRKLSLGEGRQAVGSNQNSEIQTICMGDNDGSGTFVSVKPF